MSKYKKKPKPHNPIRTSDAIAKRALRAEIGFTKESILKVSKQEGMKLFFHRHMGDVTDMYAQYIEITELPNTTELHDLFIHVYKEKDWSVGSLAKRAGPVITQATLGALKTKITKAEQMLAKYQLIYDNRMSKSTRIEQDLLEAKRLEEEAKLEAEAKLSLEVSKELRSEEESGDIFVAPLVLDEVESEIPKTIFEETPIDEGK